MNTPFVRFLKFTGHALDVLRKGLHLLLLLVVFGIIAVAILPQAVQVPSKAVLVIDPRGVLVEQLTGGPLDQVLAQATGMQQHETLVRDVLDAIDAAKDDKRIQGIFLDLGGVTGAGLSKLEDIAAALKDFRKSGKPVIAFGENYEQRHYYLAAHADEVYLDPHGMVFIDGFGYFRMFLKDAIDKLGVDVNVFRAGKFKSYTDQYSRNDMSEQEREESQAWLNELWNNYQVTVTQARGIKADALSDYIGQLLPSLRANGGDLAAVAVDRGLVNELKTRRQVEQRLMALSGEDDATHSFNSIGLRDYLQAEQLRLAQRARGKKVAVVVAAGEILDGAQPSGAIGGDTLAALLRKARYDDDVRAVVLRIDSPGGSVYASEVIRREVEALKQEGKPVIASMSSTAASGGYYIAMNADEIWASPTTLTGSIGVFAVLPTLERTLSKVGVHTDGIGTTPLAGAFDPTRSLTSVQRELLQTVVEHEYKKFVGGVAAARGKTADEIDAVAQGRVWAGAHAKEQGLVDRLGSLSEAIASAAKLGELGDDYAVDYLEPEVSWRGALATQVHAVAARLARIIEPSSSLQSLVQQVSPLELELRRLARFAESRTAQFYCVCTVQ